MTNAFWMMGDGENGQMPSDDNGACQFPGYWDRVGVSALGGLGRRKAGRRVAQPKAKSTSTSCLSCAVLRIPLSSLLPLSLCHRHGSTPPTAMGSRTTCRYRKGQ